MAEYLPMEKILRHLCWQVPVYYEQLTCYWQVKAVAQSLPELQSPHLFGKALLPASCSADWQTLELL